MVDLHIHSNCSHDSRETIEHICLKAIEKGYTAVTISDHADMGPCDIPDTFERFSRRKEEIAAAREKFGDKISVLEGIEMAEYLYDVPLAERLLSLSRYDVVLGSVHCVPFDGCSLAYSAMDFSEMPLEKIHAFLTLYFSKIKEMILKTDIDVLCHLTCPLRYINGKYGREVDVSEHMDAIKEIFSLLIEKEIALEVNTSGTTQKECDAMPSFPLLALYRSMGGRLLTLGSDAHIAERVGVGFEEVRIRLKALGFTECRAFRERKAYSLPL